MLAGVDPLLKEELQKTQIMSDIGEENVFEAQAGYGLAEDAALDVAEKWLASHKTAPVTDDSTNDDGQAA